MRKFRLRRSLISILGGLFFSITKKLSGFFSVGFFQFNTRVNAKMSCSICFEDDGQEIWFKCNTCSDGLICEYCHDGVRIHGTAEHEVMKCPVCKELNWKLMMSFIIDEMVDLITGNTWLGEESRALKLVQNHNTEYQLNMASDERSPSDKEATAAAISEYHTAHTVWKLVQ